MKSCNVRLIRGGHNFVTIHTKSRSDRFYIMPLLKCFMVLDLKDLKVAISGRAAAFRCITDYQPAGGPGDKVFPPTYEGGSYATEERFNPKTGQAQKCVLLDSVQSQSNRMELALLKAHRNGEIKIPLLTVRFDQEDLHKRFEVTSLEAPHRVADALIRDSLLDGKIFRKSSKGSMLDDASTTNATGLFGLCPTALLFGMWDSTGPRGGMGAKFQRTIVSEIIGYDAHIGKKTKSRIDPAGIQIDAGRLYVRKEQNDTDPTWTLDKNSGTDLVGKPKDKERGRPSQVIHGNIKPSIEDGGCTISKARQTTVISLPGIRRLYFPLADAPQSDPAVDLIARSTLAAMGLVAGTLTREDADLRSRCHLFAEGKTIWELLDRPNEDPKRFELGPADALGLLSEAISEAQSAGLPWEGDIYLQPSSELVKLIRLSQELAQKMTNG